MSIQSERTAQEHPAYDDGLRAATKLAAADPAKGSFTVYWDGKAIFVRGPGGMPPEDGEVVCIAQRWDDRSVQLRFAGARSEWVRA